MNRARALGLLSSTAVAAATPLGARAATIRVGATPSDSYSEPLYVDAAGAIARAGLAVEVTVFSSVGALVQALIGGAIDVGLADMLQVAGMHLHGLPYSFFAGGGLYTSTSPTTALVVPRESPISKAVELEGQTVSVVALGSLSDVVTKNWLARNGADLAKIKFIELPVSVTIPTLLRGAVAAGFIGEPFLTQFKEQIRPLGRAMDTVAPTFLISAWCASNAWLSARDGTPRRLAQALYATGAWANSHHAETAGILAGASKIALESVRAMNRVSWATGLDPRLMQPVIDAAARFHVLERPIPARDLVIGV
jgi:ABC-type nitrate/sulfonate/bicarbonate transport system substrate-binding protein